MTGSPPTASVARQLALWVVSSSLAGLAIGLAVSLFQGDGVERPILIISVLFGNVVGLTAMVGSVWLFPRLQGRSGLLRFPLLVLTLLSGAVFGSLAVLGVYPLFVLSELRLAVGVVVINGILALVIGSVVLGYEQMRLRLQGTLREMEEVRLVEARFGDRLEVAWHIDPRSLAVRVPGLVLQPLLENGVGHGLAPRARGGRIDVTTAIEDSVLRIDVLDDGVGLSDDGEHLIRDGHGLGNIARRLQTFYGGSAALELASLPGQAGTRATLRMPISPIASPRPHREERTT